MNLNSFTTAWNVSLFLIWAMSFITLVNVILRSLPPVHFKAKMKYLIAHDPQSRTAVGLLFIVFGSMCRVLLLTPIAIIADAPGKQTNLLFYIESVRPFVISFGAFFVYVGCCIVFWPTLLRITYIQLGKVPRARANRIAFCLAALFQIILLAIGYATHYLMLHLLF